MLFNSLHFLWFFSAVWVAYWALRRERRLQNGLLLGASYLFYGYWDWRFLGLILLSTLVDFGVGLALARHPRGARARDRWLVLSLVVNLGALGFFKYWDFFVQSFEEILSAAGLGTSSCMLEIILPVGISFYTFQTLSYSIDRWRGEIPAERSFIDFAFFVSFFPQLVAGPIVRAGEFLPQAARKRIYSWEDQGLGLRLILWGLFKKVVVADNLASLVDGTFAQEGELGLLTRVVAIYAFAAQIYCDFSGYTDIARGTARMLGFRFPWNFRAPYFATNPSAFWRRWHITLSNWLRDYLYISLGGNRKGRGRTLRNVMLTMVLGGLWHGAAWNFVLWGFYQGLLLVAHRLWTENRQSRQPSPAGRALQWCGFFHLVCFGWLLFRAESLAQIGRFLSPHGGWLAGFPLSETVASGALIGGLGVLVVCAWDFVMESHGTDETALEGKSPWVQAATCLALYMAVAYTGRFIGNEFIYFQF
ncbi:MAG: MBOAT family protein [bacterium]|nr:MBOAT family protein [Planctomycetota bacterium]HIL51608.1 MBOAT family protein [Planctomycetota bacterium]